MLVLDTHVLVWLFNGSERIHPDIRQIIRHACAEDKVFVSAITPWEIAMLEARSRLELGREINDWMAFVFNGFGIALKPLLPQIAIASTRLPDGIHNDPSDRLIVATARYLNATLITADRAILDYGLKGHVKVLKAD